MVVPLKLSNVEQVFKLWDNQAPPPMSVMGVLLGINAASMLTKTAKSKLISLKDAQAVDPDATGLASKRMELARVMHAKCALLNRTCHSVTLTNVRLMMRKPSKLLCHRPP